MRKAHSFFLPKVERARVTSCFSQYFLKFWTNLNFQMAKNHDEKTKTSLKYLISKKKKKKKHVATES